MDAKIGSEPNQKDALQAAIAQIARQPRRRTPVVFKKCRIGVDRGPETLAHDQLRPLGLKLRMEGRPRRALDTMIGPQGLLAIRHVDGLKRRGPRMRSGKGTVTRRMPILGQRNMAETFSKAVDERHHGSTSRNRKRPARAEVVLYINYQQ